MTSSQRHADGGHERPGAALRLGFVLWVTVSVFLFLLARCAYICLVRGPVFTEMAVAQRALSVPVASARGAITDREGEVLAASAGGPAPGPPFTHAAIFPQAVRGPSSSIAVLERSLGPLSAGNPRVVRLPADHSHELAEAARSVVGVVPFQLSGRAVSAAVLAVGHLSAASVGLDGLEASFQWALGSARQSYVRLAVDADGRCIAGLGASASSRGAQGGAGWTGYVRTTLSLPLQRAAEEALAKQGAPGAVVVLDVRTGQVLAMASAPVYDPGDVAAELGREGAPMLNRAVRAYYPGSVFKVVVAAAALEAGVRPQEWRYTDEGSIAVGSNVFRCAASEAGGHGSVGIGEMLALSCNTAAIALAEEVGAEAIRRQAQAFGIGDYAFRARLHLPSALSGRIGSVYDTASEAGLANLALGQLHVEMTPVEAATMMAAVARGGEVCVPSLVLEAEAPSGQRVVYPATVSGGQAVSPATAETLRHMLEQAVDAGTASAALGGLDCAGKTGTAQTGRVNERGQPLYNAWFTGYAPRREPRIAVAVVLESTRSGADAAAPVFRDILAFWTRTQAQASS